MTKRLTKADKFQQQVRNIFWAFDYERSAREHLDKANLTHLSEEVKAAAFAEFKLHAKWRDDKLVKAFGMTFQQLHDMAFKTNGRLA